MLATEFHGVAHAWHQHDLVLSWQSSQSIGGVMIHQGLASDQWLPIFGHLFLWPTKLEEDLHPIWSDKAHTCSSTSASIAKMNGCMDPNYSSKQGFPVLSGLPVLSEQSLNDEWGDPWTRKSILLTRDSASWSEASRHWHHWLHAAEDVVRAGDYRLS